MPWQVYLVHTVSGQVGRGLNPVGASWSIELNKADDGSVKLSKSDLEGLGREWITPWWASVVLCYVSPDGDPIPWCGGPITAWPAEDREEITLAWGGIRDVFTRRNLEKDYAFRGLSLGTIAWEVVRAAQDKPAGGRLPIVHGSPYETLSPGNQRTYEAWNLANNNVDKRLTELTNVINGPDMMFRPRWADAERTAIEWVMVHGTSWDPTIAQGGVHVWDTTAAAGPVTSPDVVSDGAEVATRVWGTGAGEGAGTTVTRAESLELVRAGAPFLESVISDPDQAKADPIRVKCEAALSGARMMVDQMSMTVQAGFPASPLGSWHVGDSVVVTLGDEWYSIPAGDRTMDIIRASGDLTELVKVELQEGQWAAPADLI